MKQIFPKEIIEFTAEHYLSKQSVKSQIIYSTVVIFIIGALASLPFIYVDITVKSRGILQPISPRSEIYSPVSGRVVKFDLQENQAVDKGQLLMKVDDQVINNQIQLLTETQNRQVLYIGDLDKLLSLDSSHLFTWSPLLKSPLYNKVLKSPLYNKDYSQFQEELTNSWGKIKKTEKDFLRDKKLFEQQVIAELEFDNRKFEYQQVLAGFRLMIKRKRRAWENDRLKLAIELSDTRSKIEQLNEERRKYKLHAATKGNIHNLIGIKEGSYVYVNQKIAEISPDSTLVVYCFVTPKDIGQIMSGQSARFRVDAFNFHQWGVLTGKVKDISNDVYLLDNQQPVFKVKCTLERDYLALKSGHKGHLRKGMTLQANFLITRRNLYQLLFDKADDWLNPTKLN